MTTDLMTALKRIYESSGLPCVIADGELNVLWKNPPAEKGRCPLNTKNISGIFGGDKPRTGMVYLAEGAMIRKFNSLCAADPADGRSYFIVEYLGDDELKALLASPPVRDYMTYLCARIRRSLGMIAVSADEIDSAAAVLGAGCGEVTEQLNTINKELMLIFREVIDPEQLYYTLDPSCDDSPICVSDELAAAASDARRSLGRDTAVVCEPEKGIFTRMNRSVFETIVSDMTGECCAGELYPEELVFSCEKLSPERAAVTIRSVCRSGRKNIPADPEMNKKGGRLYYDYLCDTLCDKYGAAFTSRELPDGRLRRMEITVMDPDRHIVLRSPKFSLRPERFCTMTLALADRHLERRYKFINIDEDGEKLRKTE